MSISLSFEDRFSYPEPNGIGSGISKEVAQTLSDNELLELSSELSEVVSMFRSYSVLLSQTSVLDIFNIVTREADPQIALILASAKSKKNNEPLFGGLGAIRELMFADGRPDATNYTNRNLFSDGIRRVSVALTAAKVVGQLAQITEQLAHSERIKADAIADLDRIILTWELSSDDESQVKKDEEQIPSAFFFEPKEFTVPAEKKLVVEWQSPSVSSEWSLVGEYTGAVETWQIVNDLSSAINTQGTYNPDNILLSAPELSGPFFTNRANLIPTQYHVLKFYPRRPVPGVLAYSINIRINTVLIEGQADQSAVAFPINQSPFIWGVHGDSLNSYIVNGSIIIIRYNKLQSETKDREDDQPFVLYFRNKEGVAAPTTSNLSFSVQPWQEVNQESKEEDERVESVTIQIERLTSDDPDEQAELDANRFSQVALALSTAMTEQLTDTYVATAIIRNDPITSSFPSAALELVPWARQRVISAVVLNILELPPDIEVATGNRIRPITTFASKPRSIMVKNPYSNSNSVVVLNKEQSYVSPRRKSAYWQAIKDEAKSITSRGPY